MWNFIKKWLISKLTMNDIAEYLSNNAEKIDDVTGEKLMTIIIKSSSNKILHYRVEQ